MYVHIREGSAAKNVEDIVKGIVETGVSVDRFNFCTDDKHIEDIEREGHISYNIEKAIKTRNKTSWCNKMASMNPATCYNLQDIGTISVGKRANLVVLSDLEENVICGQNYVWRWMFELKPLTTEEIKKAIENFLEK